MRPASTGSGRLPPGKLGASTLRAPVRSSSPAGRRARSLHVLIDVRERRLDPRRPALAGVFRPRALSRLLQIDVSTSTTLDRPNIPASGACRETGSNPGRLPFDRSSPFDRRATAEGTQGQGPRITESSALPRRIAPARDFAPTPIASGSSCRDHCASSCLEAARDGGPSRRRRVTLARHERRQSPCTWNLREELRRAGARGAFHRKAVQRTGTISRGAKASSMDHSSAFFTAGEPCEGRSPGDRQPGLSIRDAASRTVID